MKMTYKTDIIFVKEIVILRFLQNIYKPSTIKIILISKIKLTILCKNIQINKLMMNNKAIKY